ncbi:MAG: aminotransferase class V-fold PLP-dependent enzyme [Acidobacteriota bacterium]|nr:aminotransferase class V-fold PLP-dependent enzyme [Acidobacteriota bacterium]
MNAARTPISAVLNRTRELAESFLAGVDTRPVFPNATFGELVEALGGPLPEESQDPQVVIENFAAAADPGLVATPGPRYFGFVTGGSVPAAVAAEWLTAAWDQNAGLHVLSPAAAAIEHVAAGWLLELLGLPSSASVGFVTGATVANTTALAAARHEVLRRAGWDVEADGLQGAPRITVIAGRQAHASIRNATRFIGLGSAGIIYVDSDDQGRMIPASLDRAMADTSGSTIVCAQSGNVNTGAFDPMHEIEPIVHAKGAWLHVDGAFGLWAAVSKSLAPQLRGVAAADSWTVDGHKWLNVPYDSGFVIVAHPAAHRAAMSQTAEYLLRGSDEEREGQDWTPEASRRARGNAVYAAIRSLGRSGIERMIDRCCACARVIAATLGDEPGVEVVNDVVLNQVLVRFRSPSGENVTQQVARRIQQDRICWAGGTQWEGEPALRISISGWKTTEDDARTSAAAMIAAHRG